jgi:protoheme IX farnesyltransferase
LVVPPARVPVLVGWAAVTGRVEVPALALFAVVFFWTPPHFWALALRYEDDYRRAGVPMLPAVGGRGSSIAYLVALFAALAVDVLLG